MTGEAARSPSPIVLGGLALAAAVLQLFATARIGLAAPEALQAAALEGSRWYLVGIVAAAVGLTTAWALRARPLVAVLVLLAWEAAVLIPLRPRTTALGLAYHGEFVLAHFAALLAAATGVAIAVHWLAHRGLGWRRWVLGPLALLGIGLALAAHVQFSAVPTDPPPPRWMGLGTAVLLGTLALGLVVVGTLRRNVPVRITGILLLVPFVVRIYAGGHDGIVGAPVDPTARGALTTALVVAALGVYVLGRPRLPAALSLTVTGSSLVATSLVYIVYRRGFGDLEDELGGLLDSVLGFPPPYPSYLEWWQTMSAMLGLFAMLAATYASLVHQPTRGRGVALGLVLVSGVGLTSPLLGLLAGTAGLLWIDGMLEDDGAPRASSDDVPAMHAAMSRLATALELPAPLLLETDEGSMIALHGALQGHDVDLRLRRAGAGWRLEGRVATPGRDQPEVELVPDASDRGQRPVHLVARTHRLRGDREEAERLDDALLDALVPLPLATVSLWTSGSRVVLPVVPERTDPDAIAGLVRALAER